MIYQEQELERLMRCPLMTPTGPSQVETCAKALASWALRQSFEGKLIGKERDILSDIRGQLIKFWVEADIQSDPGRVARIAGFRLFNLLLDYEVIHLELPYNLILTGYTIQGKYALLRKRKGACLPHVLILHTDVPTLKAYQALPPDITTMSRLLHVRTTTKYTDTVALHYPVFQGEHWMNKNFNIPLARRYLSSIIDIANKKPMYPVYGDYCRDCSTKPCMEIFNGQDDNSR